MLTRANPDGAAPSAIFWVSAPTRISEEYSLPEPTNPPRLHPNTYGSVFALSQPAPTPTKHTVLTPKFGKESDLWVRFEKESVWWKEGYF
jgi:hypothetical protein